MASAVLDYFFVENVNGMVPRALAGLEVEVVNIFRFIFSVTIKGRFARTSIGKGGLAVRIPVSNSAQKVMLQES